MRWLMVLVAGAALSLACAPLERVSPAPDGESALGELETAPLTPTPTPAAELDGEGDPGETCVDPRPAWDTRGDQSPQALDRAVAGVLDDPAWDRVDVSISAWIDGYGEVVALDPDRQLLPASNQKLFTAMGAYVLLEPEDRFATTVVREGDDLVLVASGDPTLTESGPHSLADLARQVAAAGIGSSARLVVDATAFEAATTARGWQDWQIPDYVGPMSALMVGDNRSRTDETYLRDPALGNGELFAELLRAQGVSVGGAVVHGTADPRAGVVGSVESEPVSALVRQALRNSDNEVAESLLRLIGDGATETGVRRTEAALAGWCLELRGESGDGSGLSRANARSAREWRHLLQAVAAEPWGGDLRDDLAVAGRNGTLASRLTAPSTAGNVRAKTGAIIGGRALSGYGTTASGRALVFSIITNGEPDAAAATLGPIDALVTTLVEVG